ncbi:MAG TPA: hypothetical protein VIN61_15465 [Gammaproteobacteria bacterium]
MRRLGWLAAALLGLAAVAGADRDDAPPPDLELLEYLGSWQEGDDEWLVVEEWRRREPARPPERGRRRNEDEQGE